MAIKPWLWLPASLAHAASPLFLRAHGRLRSLKTHTWRPFTWRHLEFSNRLGIAGGVDKNGDHITDWWTLGPGFIEIGTVTPKPQAPNPKPILMRDNLNQALWNKMGFPNSGAAHAKLNLRKLFKPYFTPIMVNIGKNRQTPLETCQTDYIQLIQAFQDLADAFVINISSPNTQGLRDLFSKDHLKKFLTSLVNARNELQSDFPPPLLLKMSPDLSEGELKEALEVSAECEIDGWILTNTTLQRSPALRFPKEGGVSGLPLQKLAERKLKQAIEHLGESRKDKLVISVGGVLSPQDVVRRLELGADLVQVYAALIFSGPYFFAKTADYLDKHDI